MPNHRRIEQGGRLEGVFLGEISADEQLPVLTNRCIGEQKLPRVIEAMQNELLRLLMPAVKLSEQVGQQTIDFYFRERHRPGDDPESPLRVAKLERAHEHTRIVRL